MSDVLITTIQLLCTNMISPRLKYCSEDRFSSSVGILPVRFRLSVKQIINRKAAADHSVIVMRKYRSKIIASQELSKSPVLLYAYLNSCTLI